MNSYILLMAAIFLFVLHVSLYIHSLPLIQISEIKEATHVHDLRLLRTLNLKRNPVQVTSHNLHSSTTSQSGLTSPAFFTAIFQNGAWLSQGMCT